MPKEKDLLRHELLTTYRELKTLYMCEVKQMLRDRHTLIYTVAIPIFFYPVLLFIVFQAMALVKGWQDNHISKIYVSKSRSPELVQWLLEKETKVELVQVDDNQAPTRDHLSTWIQEKKIDAALSLKGKPPAEPLEAEIVYSSVRDSSETAKERLENLLETFRDRILLVQAQSHGEEKSFLSVLNVDQVDVASRERKSNFILSLILPLLMVVILIMA